MGGALRLASLAIGLFLFWLVLSGHYTTRLLVIGIICSVGVAIFARRANAADAEGHPIDRFMAGIRYWPWLLWEIVKSAWDVTLRILSPSLPISPTLIEVTASQKTSVGLATYANSITLTPGTVSAVISESDRRILVHALTEEAAESLAEGDMDRRVAGFER